MNADERGLKSENRRNAKTPRCQGRMKGKKVKAFRACHPEPYSAKDLVSQCVTRFLMCTFRNDFFLDSLPFNPRSSAFICGSTLFSSSCLGFWRPGVHICYLRPSAF